MQFAFLAEACFERSSEQFVSSLAFRLQRLRLDRRSLLHEVLFADGIVLGDAVDHPIRPQKDWIPCLADRKFERGGKLLRTSGIGDRPGPREWLARLHLKPESFCGGSKILARLHAFAQFVGTGLGQVQGFLMTVVSQY